MAIDATKVRELREKTGLPMMECKKALEASKGDVEAAIEALRKAGAKAQEKLAGRKATEGRVASYRSDDGRVGAFAALRCETEPVANNDEFQSFAAQLVQVVVDKNPSSTEELLECELASGGTVNAGLTDLINQLRENISPGKFRRLEADLVAQYVHFDNKKAGMVALQGGSSSDDKSEALGKDLCMHVVFHKPRSLSRELLDPTLVEKEKEIRLAAAKNDPKNAKKPDNIVEKIVDGQMNKWIQEQCFIEQPYIRDDKLSVQKFVEQSGTGMKIVDFSYVATDAE